MDDGPIERHLRRQAGVISRRQVLAAGGSEVLVARHLRRRLWARVYDGVYVDHTGPLSRRQREWAALLQFPDSVLAGRSALRAARVEDPAGDRDRPAVHLAVPHGRRVDARDGVRVVQVRGLARLVQPGASPPRLRIEPAALMEASRAAGDDAAVGVLAEVVRQGRTTAGRLRTALDGLPRLPRRALLGEVLTDVGHGVQSPLERRYLRDVERAHGLPPGDRQVREEVRTVEGEAVRVVYRDVRYAAQRTDVELDGDLAHGATRDRWADLRRDLDSAVGGQLTLRAGWRQALEPCSLAVIVGSVLASRGWTGAPVACAAPGCAVRVEVAS